MTYRELSQEDRKKLLRKIWTQPLEIELCVRVSRILEGGRSGENIMAYNFLVGDVLGDGFLEAIKEAVGYPTEGFRIRLFEKGKSKDPIWDRSFFPRIKSSNPLTRLLDFFDDNKDRVGDIAGHLTGLEEPMTEAFEGFGAAFARGAAPVLRKEVKSMMTEMLEVD